MRVNEEVWLPVPDHHPLEASSLGRVRSLPYETPMPHGGVKINQVSPTYGVVTSSKKGAAHTYRQLTFRRKVYKIHRLICLAFHGSPPTPKHRVLHDDEDAHNNKPGNLFWGTQKENLNAPGFLKYCRGRTGENSPTYKGRLKKMEQEHA